MPLPRPIALDDELLIFLAGISERMETIDGRLKSIERNVRELNLGNKPMKKAPAPKPMPAPRKGKKGC